MLTDRQRDVLKLLAIGLTNEEIAARLGISPDGVKYHVSEILRRLGVESRHQAVAAHTGSRASWFGALAPVALLRKLPLPWAPKLVAASVVVAAVAGVAVLAWGVARTQDDTGNAPLDGVIDLLLRQDIDGLIATVEMTTIGCSIEQTIGSPPPCAPGITDGTPLEAFPIGYCEGTYATQPDQIRAAFGAAISRQPTVAVYAVLRGDGADASNGYTIAVTEDVPSQATAPVSFWRISDDGAIVGLQYECGAYGAAQQVDYRFPSPDYVIGPHKNCSPGPGEYANLIVTVDGFSPGSSRPQFVGPAANTLGVPTGERAIIDVLPDTEWIGSITSLEEVRSGMELQAVGRRDEKCVIRADTIFSPESVDIVDTRLGFEASYPYGWTENAVPFPYATCTGCVTLGPRDVQYPFGIHVYTQPPDPGCDPACYFSINAISADAARHITIDGRPASRQEIQRSAPLGFVADTGDSTPYRQLATVVQREGDALLIVAFFREGDHPAEEQTRAAYEAFLDSLRLLVPQPTPAP